MWKLALVLAALACVFVAVSLLTAIGRRNRQTLLLAAALAAFCAMVCGRLVPRPSISTFEDYRPIQVADRDDPYASSERCESCHQSQFESWHASYHRTMTQVVTAQSVLGDFNDVQTVAYGHRIKLSRRGDQYWASMQDPELPPSASSWIDRPIVMSTGSHHMQVYWYATGKDRRLGQLPIVWLKETESWVPIHSIFLRPAQTKLGKAEGRWNQTCIKCHTTQGRPRVDPARQPAVDTHVAEFGIACEACHGPAAHHCELHSPTKQESEESTGASLADVVQPAGLPHERSAEVCGQCHGVWLAKDEVEAGKAMGDGLTFRPGHVLSDSRHVFGTGQPISSHVSKYLEADPEFIGDRFWPDGMVRVSGREYNGLVRSSCFQQGEMTCISCHDMHPDLDATKNAADAWADDQLTHHADSNDACLQCHEIFQSETQLVNHTHHAADSAGSQCYNCHMPHTAYGLLKAIRSHTISSPSVAETVEVGRPNACNMCHVDKTLAWTAGSLKQWYGVESPELTAEQQSYSAMLLASLSGDAGQRALAAWSLGWKPAQSASQSDWIAPVLAQLLNDPYHAVRFVSLRSLKTLPGLGKTEVDVLGTDSARANVYSEILTKWRSLYSERKANPQLLLDQNGNLDVEKFNLLLNQRDDRTVVLAE